MFFSTYVLTKKGPLAKVWLAAHWDKRLTRHEVRVLNLTQTIVHIMRPVVPIALRTSGELLVGVVRIYALKVKHLLREAHDAVLLLRMAGVTVKGGMVRHGSASAHKSESRGAARAASRGAAEGDVRDATAAADGHQSDLHTLTYPWATATDGVADRAQDVHRRAHAALCETPFRAIADLLQPGQSSSPSTRVEGTWYTMQPSSQEAGRAPNLTPSGSQAGEQEGARLRANLVALERRATPREGSSVSSDSLVRGRVTSASVERGRGTLVDLPYPTALLEELDIGVPLPEPAPTPTRESGVTFYTVAETVRRGTVVDLDATTLSRASVERAMRAGAALVRHTSCRGPCSVEEGHDRAVLRQLGLESSVVLSRGVGWLGSSYAMALRSPLQMAWERRRTTRHNNNYDNDVEAAEVPMTPWTARKRPRTPDEDGASVTSTVADAVPSTTLSATATRTLQRIRAELSNPAQPSKCTLTQVCAGLRRREVARVFVDVLGLASCGVLTAQQDVEAAMREGAAEGRDSCAVWLTLRETPDVAVVA